jgi:hypothetical protein
MFVFPDTRTPLPKNAVAAHYNFLWQPMQSAGIHP